MIPRGGGPSPYCTRETPPNTPRITFRGHNGEDPPGSNPGWVPDAVVLEEPAAEGLHKDGDGPDQASDRVDDLARLPGRSPVFANLDVTALGLGHGPRLRCPVVHGGGARGQRERCRGGPRPIGLGLPASAGPSEAGNGAPGGSFRPALDRVALRTAESCGSRRAHPRCRPERSSRSARIGIRRGCRGQFSCLGLAAVERVGLVGLLGRSGAGSCPNLLQRRPAAGSVVDESAEYQRFSLGAPARSGPLQQIWTTRAAADPPGRAAAGLMATMTGALTTGRGPRGVRPTHEHVT